MPIPGASTASQIQRLRERGLSLALEMQTRVTANRITWLARRAAQKAMPPRVCARSGAASRALAAEAVISASFAIVSATGTARQWVRARYRGQAGVAAAFRRWSNADAVGPGQAGQVGEGGVAGLR